MFAIASVSCLSCGARIADSVYLCPQCGAEVAMYVEDLRVGRLFLLVIAGSILGGIIAFTGAMFYVGIADTYPLVTGAWGFTTLGVVGLAWLAGWLAEAQTRWQLEATEGAVWHDDNGEHHG
jgi:hypothetical protein